MNQRDVSQWLRFQRRVAQLSPDASKALLDAYNVIRDSLTVGEMEALIQGDDALLDRALLRFRAKVRDAVQHGFESTIPQLPKGGKVDGVVASQFDILNPRIIDAVRTLDSRVINTLKDDVRELVKAHVENGLRDGLNPRTIARDLRPIIGMSPTQREHMLNYGAKLLDQGKTPDQVERAVNTYRRKAIALNANTNARTATVDSLKLGQHLTWEDAAAKGIVDKALLTKTWVTVGDDRVRDEHKALNGQTVGFDNAFSNGDVIPGESTWNCRCVLSYRQRRAA